MRRLRLWNSNEIKNSLHQKVQEDSEAQGISEEITATEGHFKEEEGSTDLIDQQDQQPSDQLLLHHTTMISLHAILVGKKVILHEIVRETNKCLRDRA